MQITRLTALVMVALLTTATGLAANTDLQARLTQISTDASRVRAEAQEIKALLKVRQPDYEVVEQRMETLRSHTEQLKAATAIDPSEYALTMAQRTDLEQVQKTVEVLQVFVANKSEMLGGEAPNRSMLRAKADGVAKRASSVERSVTRMLGN